MIDTDSGQLPTLPDAQNAPEIAGLPTSAGLATETGHIPGRP
jgi:hypothetical protein